MSGGLGNIFEVTDEVKGPRGPDFKVTVDVPREALGLADGFEVPVPTEMEVDGEAVPRRLGPGESGGHVRLHLPEGFADGATLRLRGQGGAAKEGGAGDLYVTVRLTDDPLPAPLGGVAESVNWLWLAVAALVVGAGAVWLALAP